MIIQAIKSYKRRKAVMKMSDVDLDKAVRIQGTKFDRKRRVSDEVRDDMRRMYFSGMSIAEICVKTGLCHSTVRYNVDDAWRALFNSKRSGAHTGVDHITFENRVEYKRNLVRTKAIRV